MGEVINRDRRRFFGTAAITLATAQLGTTTLAPAGTTTLAQLPFGQTGDKRVVRIAETD